MDEQNVNGSATRSSEPTPAVGRIVHYTPLESVGSKNQPYPAVITHVWSEDCVNLNVLNDGSFTLSGDECPTSVMKGQGPRTWAWPPRV